MEVGAMDVYETDKSFFMEVSAAGIPEDQIQLHTDANRITVRAHSHSNVDKIRYHIQERSFGKIERSITLPQTADMSRISANYKNGVLCVEIPKQEKVLSRKIDIKFE